MNPPSVENELFCLRYELRLFAAQVLEGYLERWIDGFTSPTVSLEHVQRYELAAGFVKGKRVLDLACGTGRGSRMLADAGAASVSGCDVDAEAVRYAATRNAHPQAEFRVADGLRFDEPGRYDFVVCYETIEHVGDPARLLQNLSRCLALGGRLLVSTPISKVDLDPKPLNAHHVQEWGFRRFQALVAETFSVEQVYVQYYLWGKPPGFKVKAVRKFRRAFNLALPPEPIAPRPRVVTWDQAGLKLEECGADWSGYQILLCSAKPVNSDRESRAA